jgi:hypothetical protein
MSHYLGLLTKEYGAVYQKISSTQAQAESAVNIQQKSDLKAEVKRQLDSFEKLTDFITLGEDYKRDYINPYQVAKMMMRQNIWRCIEQNGSEDRSKKA